MPAAKECERIDRAEEAQKAQRLARGRILRPPFVLSPSKTSEWYPLPAQFRLPAAGTQRHSALPGVAKGAMIGQEQMPDKKRERPFDLKDAAAYPIAEAAHFLRLPAATLRSWVIGRRYPKGEGLGHSRPVIRLAGDEPPLLSFWNLVEAHVLRALRTEHGVSLADVRQALSYAERELRIQRLFLHRELRTKGGKLFLEHYGKLINLSASGQLAMRRLFEEHLKRVEWGKLDFPIRLYPFVSASAESPERPIVIDPNIAFGRPVVARLGISTRAIAERLDAGESVETVAADYDLNRTEIEQAVLYERAA